MSLSIRRAREDDIAPLTKIVADNYSKAFAEQFGPEITCAFMPYPFRPNFLVAELQGKTIGCACWMSDWLSWGVFNLSWVQVEKKEQRSGIGRALVQECLDRIFSQGNCALLATDIPDYYERWWGFKVRHRYMSNEGVEYSIMALNG